MTIQEYFGDWSKVLNLQEASKLLKEACQIKPVCCPLPKDIFKAFHLCPLHTLRVVIIGQDPYPTLRSVHDNDAATKVPVATGVAFANDLSTSEESYSPSLKILMESVIDYTMPHGIVTFDPSLEKWEEQGVLLLNTALTCQVGQVGSHTLKWRPFITDFLTNLSKCSNGIVYILMGSQAQSLESYINKGFNHIFKTRHPSYYARTGSKMPSNIWKEVNTILIGQNGTDIKWYEEE